jgi:hypothetical protein
LQHVLATAVSIEVFTEENTIHHRPSHPSSHLSS